MRGSRNYAKIKGIWLQAWFARVLVRCVLQEHTRVLQVRLRTLTRFENPIERKCSVFEGESRPEVGPSDSHEAPGHETLMDTLRV